MTINLFHNTLKITKHLIPQSLPYENDVYGVVVGEALCDMETPSESLEHYLGTCDKKSGTPVPMRLSKIRLAFNHNNWTRMTQAVRQGVPRALRGNVWCALK